MDYISAKEAALRWHITQNRITILASQGRIEGAKLIGKTWMIPSYLQKPIDGRTKVAKNTKKEEKPFIFPNFVGIDENRLPTLTSEEKQLKEAQTLFFQCKYDEAKNALGDLPDSANDYYVKIAANSNACLICGYLGDIKSCDNYYKNLNILLAKEFRYKKRNDYIFARACFGNRLA